MLLIYFFLNSDKSMKILYSRIFISGSITPAVTAAITFPINAAKKTYLGDIIHSLPTMAGTKKLRL